MANFGFERIDGSEGTYIAILDTTATGASAIKLGAAGGPSGPVTWHVQVTGTGDIGTFLPKCVLRGSGLGPASAVGFEFVALDDTATALTTAQGATKGYIIPADEWEVYLEYTADTDPMTIYARAGRQ